MLRGDDDHHGQDGAQHDGGDAHSQADEGEVASLTGGYFRRHHVPPGYRCTHLRDARREVGEEGREGEIGEDMLYKKKRRLNTGVGAAGMETKPQ